MLEPDIIAAQIYAALDNALPQPHADGTDPIADIDLPALATSTALAIVAAHPPVQAALTGTANLVEAKPALASTTIKAALAQIITAGALAYGIDMGADTAQLFSGALLMIAWAAWGIVGRLRAHQPIAQIYTAGG